METYRGLWEGGLGAGEGLEYGSHQVGVLVGVCGQLMPWSTPTSTQPLDAMLGEWAAGHIDGFGVRRAVAVDGTPCGAHGARSDPARHLMAAIDHHAGVVIGQVDVPGTTNEIPMFSQLCDQIADLEGVVVTADAMHCQTAHADHLVLQRGAHYVLTVTGNQPALRNQHMSGALATCRTAASAADSMACLYGQARL